jgi:hypothetical protein
MAVSTNDKRNHELSIGALDTIAAGRGFPLPEPHLPPHFPPPAPSPIWAGGSVGLAVPFKLF